MSAVARRRLLLRRITAFAPLLALCASPIAGANPNGATVVHGQASFANPNPDTLVVSNSPGAIISWQDFSIAANELTRFQQANAASAVLNRVIGQDPSQILGQLQSNGRVFLINPNGMVFGRDAMVDTAALIASTLDIGNADFLAGRLQFAGDNSGSLLNQGNIHAHPGGEIVFVAPHIKNQGVLDVEDGRIVLAAGDSVRLSRFGLDDVTFEVRAGDHSIDNLGDLVARQGLVALVGGNIEHSGRINADTLSVDRAGRIVLSTSGNATLAATSQLSASGARGGDIRITSGDTTLVSGRISSNGDHQAGSIQITGDNVGLLGADLSANSSRSDGGEILVGGGWQGNNPALANASNTYISTNSSLSADAGTNAGDNADGGTVVVWADANTRYFGSSSARGAGSGRGGAVEVSGKINLAFDGQVDVGSDSGLSGLVLLDPANGTIQNTTAANDAEVADGLVLFGDGGTADFFISEQALEALAGNIDLQFSQNLTINSNVNLNLVNQTAGESVSMRAGGNITALGSIITNGADVLLSAGDAGAGSANPAAALTVSGSINTINGSGNGAITLRNPGSAGVSVNSGGILSLGTGQLLFDTPTARLNGGTINGGVLRSSVDLLTTATNSSLNGVTLDLDLVIPNTVNVFARDSLTINNGRSLSIRADNSSARLFIVNDLTIDGTGSIVFDGTSNNGRISPQFSGIDLVLANGLTVGGAASTRGGSIDTFNTLTNNTIIDLLAPGGSTSIAATTLTNNNSIRVSNSAAATLTGLVNASGGLVQNNGGTLTLAGNWTNPAGVIDQLAGTLNLGGTFSALGSFNRPAGAGTVNITGILNNPGTFTFDDTTGVVTLAGGTINGGTLAQAGTGNLLLGNSSSLNSVTLDLDLVIPNTVNVFARDSLTINNGRTLSIRADNSSARLFIVNDLTIDGTGSIVFDGTSNNGRISPQFSGIDLVLANGLTVGGAASTRGGSIDTFSTLTNNTIIDLLAPGSSTSIAATTLTNNNSIRLGNSASATLTGLVNASGGLVQNNGGTLTLAGNWTNPAGVIDQLAGTLNLGGTFSALGSFNRPAGAGTVNITGILNNPGTFTFDDTTGVVTLAGGTINGGTLAQAGTGNLLLGNSSSLNGVTLDLDLVIPNTVNVFARDSLTINTGRTLAIRADNSSARLFIANDLTIDGTGSIVFDGSTNNGRISPQFSGIDLVLANGLTVGGAASTRGGSIDTFSTLTNNTIIDLLAPGSSTSIAATTLTNNNSIRLGNSASATLTGLVNASGGLVQNNGGTLTLAGNWTNPAGVIDQLAGTLNLGGTFSALGSFNRPAGAGTVNITGILNNPGTFTFDDTTGVVTLAGGTINGGTLAQAGTGNLLLGNSSSLNGVTLDLDLVIPNTVNVFARDSLTINTGRTLAIRADNSSARLFIANDLTIDGTGSIVFDGSTNNGRISPQFSGIDLVLANGLTVGGAGSTQGGTIDRFGTLTNRGTIAATGAGTLTVNEVTNDTGGILRTNGGALALAGNWSNPAGALELQAGDVLTLDGTFTSLGNFVRPGGVGTLNLTGTLNNPGVFTFDDNTGVINLAGGTIVGGTITQAGSGNLVIANNSRLTGVTLDMDLQVPNAQTLFLSNGLTIASGRALSINAGANSTRILVSNDLTIDGTGSIVFNGSGINGNLGPNFSGIDLVLANGLTVGGAGSSQSGSIGTFTTLTNRATIESATPGTTITVNGVTNDTGGVLRTNGGNLTLGGTWSNPAGAVEQLGTGTLSLDGTFSNLGTFTRPAGIGTVNLAGTFNNSGTFTFDDSTGVFRFTGGNISGGTLAQAGSGNLVIANNSRLTGVTLDMDLQVPNAQTLFLSNGLTIASGRALSINAGANSTRILVSNDLTIDGTGSIVFNGSGINGNLGPNFSGIDLVLANGLTVGGAGSSQSGSIGTFTTLTNRATIESATPGTTITVNGVTNDTGGVLRANGGNLTLGGTWSNPAGAVEQLGTGTLTLDGTFSNLGTLTRPAGIGTVNLPGTFNNSGTFTFDDSTGVFRFTGGNITGGTLAQAGSGNLVIANNGRLTGVTLDMDLQVPNAQTLFLSDGLTVANGRALSIDADANSTRILVSNDLTIDGTGSIVFNGSNTNGALAPNFGGIDLVLENGLTVGGTGSSQSATIGTFNSLTNRATISATTPGTTLTVNGVSNDTGGVINANGAALNLGGNWNNPGGTLMVSGSGSLGLGGSFNTIGNVARSGGSITLTGTFTNTGNTTTFDDNLGVVNLAGGSIVGGTLAQAGAGGLALAGTSSQFTDVVLDMDLAIGNATTLQLAGSFNLAAGRQLQLQSGNNLAQLSLRNDMTLDGAGEIVFAGTSGNDRLSAVFGGIDLTVGPNLTLRTAAGSGGANLPNFVTITNNGTMDASNGGPLTLRNLVSNTGTLAFGNGSINNSNLGLLNTGTLSGNGSIDLNSGAPTQTLTNQGSLLAGNSPGLMSIDGNLVLSPSSVIELEIQDFGRGLGHDAFNVTGTTTLDGTLNISHLAGFTPTSGDIFHLIAGDGSISGTFANLTAPVSGYELGLSGNNLLLGFGPLGTVNLWNTDSSGVWQTPGNWSLGQVPLTTDIAFIDRGPANPTITLNTGNQAALRLFSTENMNITSGAVLDLASSSRFTNSGSLGLFGSTLAGTGDLSLAGGLTWNGGQFLGSGALNLAGVGGTFANTGVLERNLTIASGAQFNITTGSTLSSSTGANINAMGELAKVTSTSTATLQGVGLMGNVRVETGTLALANGTALTGNLALLGTGPVQITGAVDIANPVTVSGPGPLLLDGVGAVVGGSGQLTLAAPFTWLRGAMTGTGRTLLAAPASLTGTGNHNLERVLEISTGGSLDLADLSTLSSSSGTGAVITSGGELSKTTGTGQATLDSVDLAGTVRISTGSLVLAGASNLLGDLTLAGTGPLVASGQLSADTNLTISGPGVLQLNAPGTGNGLLGSGTITMASTLQWFSGLMGGAGSTIINGMASVLGAGPILARELAIASGGQIDFIDGSQLDGTGTLAVQAGGTLMKATGAGSATINPLVTNAGSVQISSGQLITGNLPTNAGTLTIASGAVLTTNQQDLTNNGQVSGDGTLNLAGNSLGTFTNNGTLAAGTSPGQLNILGNLVLGASSQITAELGGTTAGTSYDVIQASGGVTLGGALTALFTGGFSPSDGDSFRIITGASLAGAFASTNLPSNVQLLADPTAALLRFNTIAPCPGSICFDNDTGSFAWNDPLNWNTNTLPGSGDDVVIELLGANVLLGSGVFQINSLTTSNNSLSISGGSLQVAGTSSLLGQLNVSAGTFAADGSFSSNALAISGGQTSLAGSSSLATLALSDGSLDVAGALAINNLATWTGGIWQGSGSATIANGARLDTSGSRQLQLATLINQGQLRIQTGTLLIANGSHQFTGDLNTNPGTSISFTGGNHSFAPGSTLSGSGTVIWDGAQITLAAGQTPVQVTGTGLSLELRSGQVTGAGSLAAAAGTRTSISGGTFGNSGSITLAGDFLWSGGTLGNGMALRTSGQSELLGSSSKTLQRSWQQAGNLRFTSGDLDIAAGQTLANESGAQLMLALTAPASISGAGTVSNNTGATLLQTADSAVCTINSRFDNSGLLDLAGELQLQQDFSNAGRITLAGGGTPGQLTLSGNLTLLPSSQLQFGLTAAGANGVAAGQLAVAGSAQVNGSLELVLADGLSPAPGSTLNLISGQAVAGDFTSINLNGPQQISGQSQPTGYLVDFASVEPPVQPPVEPPVQPPVEPPVEPPLAPMEMLPPLPTAPENTVLVQPQPSIIANLIAAEFVITDDNSISLVQRRRTQTCN